MMTWLAAGQLLAGTSTTETADSHTLPTVSYLAATELLHRVCRQYLVWRAAVRWIDLRRFAGFRNRNNRRSNNNSSRTACVADDLFLSLFSWLRAIDKKRSPSLLIVQCRRFTPFRKRPESLSFSGLRTFRAVSSIHCTVCGSVV